MALSALAQTPFNPTDQQEQRERAERQAQERAQRQALPEVRGGETASESQYTDTQLPQETPCFQLDRLVLEGAVEHRARFGFAQHYLNQYQGRCVGQAGIGLIVRRVSDLILARGYVTSRVGLPEQNLADGTLRLQLIPGTIGAIRFADEDGMPARIWRSAFPARPGQLLNLRDLEQGLEQLKRVPSQDATMEIVPGDGVGQSDVVIMLVTQRRWRGSVSFDDSGSRATGKPQVNANLGVDNLAGRNDLLALGISSDGSAEAGRGTHGYNASYSIPWGNWRIGAGVNGYRYRQTMRGAVQDFSASGRSRSTDLTIERLLKRGQHYRSGVELRIGQRQARSYIENVEVRNQRRRTTSLELALLHRQYWGPAQIDLRLAHRRGVPWLGGDDDASGTPSDYPTYRYALTTLDASLMRPVPLGVRQALWNSALRYQWSDDPLYGSEFISIGGRYTVNGYDGETTLGGARGGYWRNSLSLPLHRAFVPYVGIDVGHIESDRQLGIEGGTLSGGHIGFRGDAAGAVTWDAFVGWPIDGPRGYRQRSDARAYGLRVAYQF
jgi:hemolysin activation/secretion protein